MKTNLNFASAVLILAGMALPAAGQFNSGSTGADGALNVTSNVTLNLPTNGIFNFTTITVASGRVLRFNRNPLNTPVYLLATGDVLVNGEINVNGEVPTNFFSVPGGPGGFDGGYGGYALNNTAGSGFGPGGGTVSGEDGVFGTNYGNALLVPIIGGSGGAGVSGSPNIGGCGGGGAIVISSSTRITINGIVYARGGYYSPNAGNGSGGAIRVVAPIVDGTGDLDAWGNGSVGRIRVDCVDRYAFRNLNYPYGLVTRGSQMFVFPTNPIPRLDIIQAAGQSIPEGAPSGVAIQLPLGSSTNQTVRVQARNFTNDVPINVIVTPENGPKSTYLGTILQSSGNPPSAIVNVQIPAGIVCRINAWTR